MSTWGEFAAAAPTLAAYGAQRLADGVAYLATVRADGSPRVHPVTPIIGQGRLFLFMEPTSPKGGDLRRDGRYALHCAVADSEGGAGEFYVTGRATAREDTATRDIAAQAASYTIHARYILFELSVERAAAKTYDTTPATSMRWKAQ